MRPLILSVCFRSAFLILAFSAFLFFNTSCKKADPEAAKPVATKFTELQIDPAFQFNSFFTIDLSVNVTGPGSSIISLIQVYDGNPAQGGKTVMSGATDANSKYSAVVRVPSRLKELWLGRIAGDGKSEFVSVPITSTAINYTFGQASLKSGDSSGDCDTGTPITVNGSYTIGSGAIYVVQQGYNLTNLKLTINQGGTVRVCGIAHITELNGTGKLIISQSGYLTVESEHVYLSIENYGTFNYAQPVSNTDFKIEPGGSFENWGTLTVSNGFYVKGILTNYYHITCLQNFQTTDNGQFTNHCQMFVNSSSNEAFKITSGTSGSPGFVNSDNAFVKVTGTCLFTGDGYTSLGSQSLIETGSFKIEGHLTGPASQGSQIHGIGGGSQIAGGNLQGYIDVWCSSVNPKNGAFGSHITWHTPGYNIAAQDCSTPVTPEITSILVGAGTVGLPITPYVITATGTNPIIYNATNLPAGLTFNATTHTISGTPTTSGSRNITLTADNQIGSSTKVLVFSITPPPSPPMIISHLNDHSPVNQPYTYIIDANGGGTITYSVSNLPTGLSFNSSTHTISGSPSATGTFSIPLHAVSPYGTDNKTLVLRVGSPPSITSALTASATTGQQFTGYQITAIGAGPITLQASNIPAGLYFSDEYNSIQGTPVSAQNAHVTLSATNDFGNNTVILVIAILDPVVAPQINSSLSVQGYLNQPFSYQITALGTRPITFNVTNLPAGLSFDSEFGVISGISAGSGNFSVNLTATNGAGSDVKVLVISVPMYAGGYTDSDGDGVGDAIDAYPNDAARAFNSYYPNETDYGTYAFEDYWPDYGDYDFNDLVVNFNYKIVTNAQNKIVDLVSKYQVKAAGAGYNNGFGVSLNVAPSNVASVTGCIKVGSVVNIADNGCEAGQTDQTVFFPVDAVKTLFGKALVNTVPTGNSVQPEVATVTVNFSTPQTNIGAPPYNPFIFVDQDRGKEIHLKDHPPTALANPVYFGALSDDSKPSSSMYYRSASGLPWGLEIPADFSYPTEKSDVIHSYLHFADWAQSSGTEYADWYQNKPGYWGTGKIY